MSAAKNALYKWGLPLMILFIGAVYITSPFGASEANRSLAVSEEASENPHRHLIAPYDTSVKIALPAFYNSMADIWEPLGPKDTAFLWSIPRTGSGTFQRLIWWCMGKVVAGRSCLNCNNRVGFTLLCINMLETPSYVELTIVCIFRLWPPTMEESLVGLLSMSLTSTLSYSLNGGCKSPRGVIFLDLDWQMLSLLIYCKIPWRFYSTARTELVVSS